MKFKAPMMNLKNLHSWLPLTIRNCERHVFLMTLLFEKLSGTDSAMTNNDKKFFLFIFV